MTWGSIYFATVLPQIDIQMISQVADLLVYSEKPIIYAGGVSQPSDCSDLIEFGKIEAVGCSSIFHFTNFTPEDCRADLRGRGLPARHDY